MLVLERRDGDGDEDFEPTFLDRRPVTGAPRWKANIFVVGVPTAGSGRDLLMWTSSDESQHPSMLFSMPFCFGLIYKMNSIHLVQTSLRVLIRQGHCPVGVSRPPRASVLLSRTDGSLVRYRYTAQELSPNVRYAT